MKKKIAFLLITLICASCKNVLEETEKKDTEKAIYYEAKMALNNRNYGTAISLLQSLSAEFRAQREVALVYASAHSGRCGMEFVSLVESLSNFSGNNIFHFLMQGFVGGTDAKISDCQTSEGILNQVGDYTQRAPDENMLMGFSALTKVGTILSRYVDTDNDGTTDPSFNHCSTTDFPDAAVREVGTGMANAIMSITAVASDISSGTLDDIQAYCNLDSQLNVFCTNTDPAAYSPLQVAALRQLLGSSDMGIGACPNFTDMACVCP